MAEELASDSSVAPPDPEVELRELLRASSRGQHDAFAALYDRLAPRVFGLALRIVRDQALAEEVVQEAMLEVWKSSARFDAARGSVSSWVLTITHRRAVDRVRSVEAANRRDETYVQRNRDVSHDSTAEHVEATFEARRVRSALQSLTAMQREAVELAYFGGYTHAQVATQLDLPLGTAKTRIRDGLIRLRDALGVGGE